MSKEKVLRTFTCASEKDHQSRVTLPNYDFPAVKKGSRFAVTIVNKGRVHHVLFYCNRGGQTLKTTSWPKGLPSPKIGSPVVLQVTNFTAI